MHTECSVLLKLAKKHTEANYTKILGKPRNSLRSTTAVKEGKSYLEITISAGDLSALRASTNTIMRDISTVESVLSQTKVKTPTSPTSKNRSGHK